MYPELAMVIKVSFKATNNNTYSVVMKSQLEY